MNNKFLKILFVGLTLVMVLSASKPTIDGRAVVADEGVLPVGLFAKSANYMPGDTVIVTNPSAKVSIEVMIFGSFDSSEGIAIILSPEAAKHLYIAKGSNSIVQVTKARTGYNEKTVLSSTLDKYETVVDPDKNSRAYIDDSIPYVEEEIVAEEILTEAIIPVEAVAEVAEVAVAEVTPVEPVEPVAELETIAEAPIEPVADVAEVAETEAIIPVEPVEPVAEFAEAESNPDSDIPVLIPEDIPAIEKTDTQEILDLEKLKSDLLNKPIEEVAALPEEIAEETPEFEEIIEEPVTIMEIEASTNPVETDTSIAENTIDEVVEVVEVPEEIVLDEEIPLVEENEYVMAEPEVLIVPNVLVPTESNPPPAVDEPEVLILTPYPDVTEEMTEIDDPMAFLPAVEESLEQEPFVPVPDTKATEIKPSVSIFDYVINSEKEIGTGSYYIQLATYKLEENIIKLISTYGNKYPIKLLRSDTIDGYKVMVGPLNGDEYPVVLQRFIGYGYKDAFIRLVK